MQLYIGTKRVLAKEMTRQEYNDYRGWEMPIDEIGSDKGYLVEYPESHSVNHIAHRGYISWSPAMEFEKAYRSTEGLTYGLALEALKAGDIVARRGWNGKTMFIFMRPEASIPVGAINDIASLPRAMKDQIYKKYGSETKYSSGEPIHIKFTPYLCMKAADDTIVNGWLASQTDMLAEDWHIL